MGDNFGLSDNAVKIFDDLYSFQEENIKETFERVADEFATNEDEKEMAYDLLADGYWRPNTPVFLNAGTDHKVFSACYVVGLEDSMDSIYDIANVCRKIFQYGAGVGIPIGNLREKEAWIYEGKPELLPEGKSSGPITFMKLYDAVGETTKSGGRVRRAAILVSMPVWHPDIMDFINCKEIDGRLANMNISVLITDKFMQNLEDKIPYDLISPKNGTKKGEIDPQVLWGKIAEMAWKTADPGVIFIDRMNKYNTLAKKMLVNCTNPCGEQPLVPFNACNLSAINIAKFVKPDETFDWDGLYDTTFNIMLLMDNLVDSMHFPDDDDEMRRKRFRTNTLRYRPVGVGPMGLADAMFMLGYKYDSADGRKFAGEIMKTMTRACVHRSALLAKEKGSFYDYSVFKEDVERIIGEHIENDEKIMKLVKEYGVRNCQFTTCQPTGCLVGNTLISSKGYGVRKIENADILSGSKTKSDNGEYTYKNWYNQGIRETKKIVTSRGYEIQGTYDHKIRVVNEKGYIWKRIDKIENGDFVVMRKDFINDGTESTSSWEDGPVIFPHEISEFLGYYMADGWWIEDKRGYGRLYLSVNYNDEEYVDNLLKDLKKWFSFKVSKRKTDGNCFKYDIPCTDMYINLFRKINAIKHGSENAFIPDFILHSTRETILNFIKGYFKGDGCITTRDKEVIFTTVSKTMAKQLHTILLGLGYPSKLKEYKVKKGQTIEICGKVRNCNHDVYKICISNFYSCLFGKNIGIEIEQIRKNIREKIVVEKEERKLFRCNKVNGFYYTSYDKYISIENSNWFFKNDLMLEQVKEVIDCDDEFVYDMEIEEKGHTYVANGFVTHNTTALSCDASYGIEPSFGLVFQKNLISGETMIVANSMFEKKCKDEGIYSPDLLERISKNGGSLKGLHNIPKKFKRVFVTAHDIKYKDRIDMQAELQKYCSTAISSTVNLARETEISEISELYKYAYERGLKGITIYRDGSKENQPVTFKDEEKKSLLPFDRPNVLNSKTHLIETGNGKMYVTVCHYEGKPVEIFFNLGKSGQILNTLSEALGRVISIGLQNGVPAEEITKTLININSDKMVWWRFEATDKKPTQILSIPDGVAKLIDRYYSGTRYEGELSGEICEKCGNYMTAMEGCFNCPACGHSKCS